MSGASASRRVRGGPRDQRSRSVRMTDVLRYSWFTTVRRSTHAEIAMVGIRTPARSKRNPI